MYFTNPLIPYCYIYVITKKCKSTLHHLADRQTLQSGSESTLHHGSILNQKQHWFNSEPANGMARFNSEPAAALVQF